MFAYFLQYKFLPILEQMSQNLEQNKSTVQISQKFHLKSLTNKSMIDTNLNTAIKKSNVKNFIKKGVGSPNENSLVEDPVDQGLEGHLLQLKKSCSDLSREVKNREEETSKYKDEAAFTCGKARKIKDERQRLEDKIAQLERNLDKVTTKRQSALHSSKTYEHILERMKKDDIHKQLQKNQLERQLKLLEKSHYLTEAKCYSAYELEKLSYLGVKDANQQLEQQKDLRKSNLNSVNKEAAKKTEKQNKLNQRQKQTDQIQELAACDIQDADLMRLKKFLTVQVFLRELLKSKMLKLKQYYEPYEQAFFQIKSNTGVRDANSLKSEFFNFENNYNEKTVWVKHLEEEITEAQQENKSLKAKLSELKIAEMEAIERMENKCKPDQTLERKHLHEKSLLFEQIWERVQFWLKIQAKKVKITDIHQEPEKLLAEIVHLVKPQESEQKLVEPDEKKQEKISVKTEATEEKPKESQIVVPQLTSTEQKQQPQ